MKIGMVQRTRDGVTYCGVFAIWGNWLTVTHGNHQKAAAVNGSVDHPEWLAGALLHELLGEA